MQNPHLPTFLNVTSYLTINNNVVPALILFIFMIRANSVR